MDYIRRSTEGFFQLARMWLPVLINQLSIPVKIRKQTSRPLVFEKEAANITIDTVIFCFFVEFGIFKTYLLKILLTPRILISV